MTKTLEKLGQDKTLVLTPEMLTHLGASDEVEVTLEDGKIVITAPRNTSHRAGKTFEDAMESTFERYPQTMRDLAKAG